jgi:hypothetical protein
MLNYMLKVAQYKETDNLDSEIPKDAIEKDENYETQVKRLTNKIERMRNVFHDFAKRGANPITEYGYGTERPWVQLANYIWEHSNEILSEKD